MNNRTNFINPVKYFAVIIDCSADGRWISRYPIEEEAGWNLYAFSRHRKRQSLLNRTLSLLSKQ